MKSYWSTEEKKIHVRFIRLWLFHDTNYKQFTKQNKHIFIFIVIEIVVFMSLTSRMKVFIEIVNANKYTKKYCSENFLMGPFDKIDLSLSICLSKEK